ncbi:tetratricopeptide repeat-containing sensor histidine kinase [Flavobacterium sp. ENC]|uniref:tetratricopeptide repeat-containing sensor histidine kinase n=1 Tax=Flavobacterium sp. ENC TaxID=2897330 RepID=UPI001E49D41F|nr:tetratricopeptide repeat-containing sensor histidine kinase [Flavobacterium sp. ENC]MCD0466537.1 ATP-binding protein [Flavobacterium sp. ENC]
MKNTINPFLKQISARYFLAKIAVFLLVISSVHSCRRENHILYKQKDHTAAIKKIIDTADFFFDTNKRDSAFYYFNKALSLSEPTKNPDEYVYSLACMSEMLQLEGDYIKSEYLLTKTMPYLNKTTRPRYKWYVYTVMAKNYHNTYDLKNALLYNKMALKHTLSILKKNQTLSNIAGVYTDQEKYDEAIKIYFPLVQKNYVDKNNLDFSKRNHAIELNNLGYCYYKTNNPKALQCFNESLKINLQINDQEGVMFNHRFISFYYLKTNPKLAQQHAKLAYEISIKDKFPTKRISFLSVLVHCSSGEDLKKYVLEYIHLTDSIREVRLKAKNQFAQIKYDSKLDKAENLQLKTLQAENELQLERQKNRNIISYIIISCILVLISFLFFHFRIKGNREKNEAIYNSEIRISEKLKKELSNTIYDTISFAKIEDLEKPKNKELLLNNLEIVYSRTRNISKENSHIVTDENYVLVLKEMIAGFKTPNVNILLNGLDTIAWNNVDKNKKIILYRVILELFTNMKMHSEATLASITFKINNKILSVNYTDNGVGLTKNAFILKNGLQNVESRIKTINGTIIFDTSSRSGFKLSFTFSI